MNEPDWEYHTVLVPLDELKRLARVWMGTDDPERPWIPDHFEIDEKTGFTGLVFRRPQHA